jgi:hypothetical protein
MKGLKPTHVIDGDLMIVGHPNDVKQVKKEVVGEKLLFRKDEDKLLEYVGAKCDLTRDADGIGTMKITQPVLVQKLKDIYGKPKKPVITPTLAGKELIRGDGAGTIEEPAQITQFCSGTVLCMYMMQWLRPEVQNTTRSCARMMQKPREVHEPALQRLAHYIISTPEHGLLLHPNRKWDGSRKFSFEAALIPIMLQIRMADELSQDEFRLYSKIALLPFEATLKSLLPCL